MIIWFLAGRVQLLPPSAHHVGRRGLGLRLEETVQADQGAGRHDVWARLYLRSEVWTSFRYWPSFYLFFNLIIWLRRATLDFDVGDNTCKSCGPACREEDYEKLVTTFLSWSSASFFLIPNLRFLQPNSMATRWRKAREWRSTSCLSMSRQSQKQVTLFFFCQS